MLNLHQAKFADWENIKDEQRNIWQKIAYRSYGTLTPANLASLIGAALGLYGLWLIYDGQIVTGLIYLIIGRIADLVDGLVAEYTKTKSPLGETVDAVADKIVIGSALIVYALTANVPLYIIIVVAFFNILNALIAVVSKLNKKIIHPSKFGKYSTALSWVTLIFYPLGVWVKDNESQSSGYVLIALAFICFAFYIFTAALATASYGRMYRGA